MGLPDVVRPLLDAAGETGVLTDFDGTLAPIVDDPARSRPLPSAVSVLDRLARHVAVVGVISGRPVEFLQRHLGERLWLSGLYGLEQVVDGERRQVPEAERWRPVVADVAARAQPHFGSLVEEKGLSLTIHFRTAPGLEAAVRRFADAEASRTGLEVRPARASVELHPPVPADKGTALEAMAGRLRAVCFLGDDVGDLTAFDALDRLATGGASAVRIGVRSEESPDELLERADLVVDGPDGAVALLHQLAAAFETCRRP